MTMPLWLADAPLVLASKAKRAARCWRTPASRSKHIPPISTSAASRQRPRPATRARSPRCSRAKARAVAARLPGRLVLGADQTLALGERRFSKPVGRDGARQQLKALRGATHTLHSAIALVRDDAVVFEHRDVARLTMRAFSDHFLEAYLDAAGAAVTASVGGYQLEKIGIELFERVEGSHFTILGLPILALLEHLRRVGQLAA